MHVQKKNVKLQLQAVAIFGDGGFPDGINFAWFCSQCGTGNSQAPRDMM